MKTVTTPKGTKLPLTNLKGKDYLMVAYRIQWMNEEHPNFEITTEFPLLTEEQTVARANVKIWLADGSFRLATATKRETKKDFNDHTEKAETAAIGRALAMLGFGTQFAIADLDEGERIVDSPVADVKLGIENASKGNFVPDPREEVKETKKPGSFRKPKPEVKKEEPPMVAAVDVTPEQEAEWG